ncbi:hypothetical protein FGM00_13070 [Aggregatimonas sangjinii]|uniref:TonB C-terminal domain-containing protein n=1 Tax=Aggregatimonas sangjinii TaxID=2583587 RepID=A0A5B7SR06_9FLAO|nr:hypothetical protein [Aggregatimonas sangjinii]QCX00997.1 hypothetical protein FGM00_13070 [Aggregatimonas sangjinii]
MTKVISLISIVSLIFITSISCQSENKNDLQPEYTRFVGDISPDSILDASDFKVCNEEKHIFQYFNTGDGFKYKGEKPALVSKIKNNFKPIAGSDYQNGYIRIRFIINCKGESGRYSVLSSDFSYEPKKFDQVIVNQLLTLVEELDGWETISKNGTSLDYYMYLIFKIENGRIIEILP